MSRYLRVNDVLTTSAGEQSARIVLGIDPIHDRVELFDAREKRTEQYSLRTLRMELATGILHSDAPAIVSGTVRNIATNSPAFKTFLFRLALAKKLHHMVAGGKSKGEAIKCLSGKTITLSSGETLPMCSEREAYRILRLYDTNESALMPAYGTRGNRTVRYGTRMAEIVDELAETMYSTEKSKISVPTLTKLINHAAHSEGILADENKVSRKFVRTSLINHWNPDLDHKRLDPRLAKSAKAVAATRIRPGAPLSRVEIDTLHLPMLALNEYGLVEDLYVMLAIDCDTSHPISWWLMLAKPTTEDTFSCLERAIYPKAALLDNLAVKFTIDPFGAILNLVMDNGQENSKIRLASVTRVGINPTWTEVDSGHRKPFIERLNRSLKVALEGLPGCTRFNGKDGARTEAAKTDQLMTVATLEHWIVRWLFEKWPNTQLDRFVTADYEIDKGLGLTPADRWRNHEAHHVLPICPPAEEWRRCRFLPFDKPKSLSNKTGVSMESFRFRGPNLKKLITQYGPNSRVNGFYNPHDFRMIYVPDKTTEEWIVLINAEVTELTPAFSFADAKQRRKTVKATYTGSTISDQFDYDLCEKIMESKQKKPSRTEARRTSQATNRTQEAVNRAKAAPLPGTSEIGNPTDTYIADDAIPTFSTHQKTSGGKR